MGGLAELSGMTEEEIIALNAAYPNGPPRKVNPPQSDPFNPGINLTPQEQEEALYNWENNIQAQPGGGLVLGPGGVETEGGLTLDGQDPNANLGGGGEQATDKEFYEWLNTPAGEAWYGDTYNPVSNTGVQGVQGTQPTGGLEDLMAQLTPEKTGYESSSNKDFYQKQFQDMRTQEAGNDMREWAAAIKAQEAAAAPQGEAFGGDPWSWTELPQVQMGGSTQATPVEWGLAPGITSDMTNKQAVGQLSSVLNPDELAMMTQHWIDAPETAANNNWLTSNPSDLTGQLGEVSPEFGGVLQKVYNNLYTQTGGGSGGFAVPDGYANPVNMPSGV